MLTETILGALLIVIAILVALAAYLGSSLRACFLELAALARDLQLQQTIQGKATSVGEVIAAEERLRVGRERLGRERQERPAKKPTDLDLLHKPPDSPPRYG